MALTGQAAAGASWASIAVLAEQLVEAGHVAIGILLFSLGGPIAIIIAGTLAARHRPPGALDNRRLAITRVGLWIVSFLAWWVIFLVTMTPYSSVSRIGPIQIETNTLHAIACMILFASTGGAITAFASEASRTHLLKRAITAAIVIDLAVVIAAIICVTTYYITAATFPGPPRFRSVVAACMAGGLGGVVGGALSTYALELACRARPPAERA